MSTVPDPLSTVETAFSGYMAHLEAEHAVREDMRAAIKDLEQTARELAAVVQKIHMPMACKKRE